MRRRTARVEADMTDMKIRTIPPSPPPAAAPDPCLMQRLRTLVSSSAPTLPFRLRRDPNLTASGRTIAAAKHTTGAVLSAYTLRNTQPGKEIQATRPITYVLFFREKVTPFAHVRT